MNTIAILIAITLFFWLQAFYWFFTARRSKKESALIDRLGTDESFLESTLVRQGVDSGTMSRGLVRLLAEAGEEPVLGPFFIRVMVAFLVVFVASLILLGELGGSLIFGMMGMSIPYMLLNKKRSNRMNRIEEQLPEALEVMTISLRAGHSLEQTIRLTATELDDPIGVEFRQVSEEVGLGRPLDEALVAMTSRLKECRTVRTFVVSVLVLHQTGGNLIEVLEGIIETMRMQGRYERKLRAMTAEGRSSARMLGFLPPVFVTLAFAANSSYVSILFYETGGQIILTVSVTLYIIGTVWTRRLVNPKV